MVMRTMIVCGLALAILSTVSCAQRATYRSKSSPKHIQVARPAQYATGGSFSPRVEPFSEERLSRLTLPAGFRVTVFARNVKDARIIAVGPSGVIYVTQPDAGQVTMLRDVNGRGEGRRVVVSGPPGVHGIAIRGGRMYLAAPTRLYVAALNADGTVGMPRRLADLPAGGVHRNRTLGFGTDGLLYVSIGSTCNACVESDRRHATIIQMRPAGSGARVFARGLRNTEAFDWHPVTHALWGMDQGIDNLGPNTPPEELNHLVDGGNYGWPWCYGDRKVNPEMTGHPRHATTAQYCARTTPSTLGYQAHSSPIQLKFYTGALFPAEYRHDAFQTFHGSWNRRPATGYKVVRIRFDAQGQPTGFTDFLTGFLSDDCQTVFGRPAGLAIAPDGALLIGDDSNGVIYRVAYRR